MKILNSSSTGSIISSDYNWKELSLELINYKDKFSLDINRKKIWKLLSRIKNKIFKFQNIYNDCLIILW